MSDQKAARRKRWDSSTARARTLALNAEPFLHIATETLGDLDPLTSSLYIRATGLSLLGDFLAELPMSVEGARRLTQEVTLHYHSPDDHPTIMEFSDEAETSFPDLLGSDFPFRTTPGKKLRPAATSAPVRRRRICSVLGDRLYAVEEFPSLFDYRGTGWEEIAKALTRLAPVTLVPYYLRPRISRDGDVTSLQIEEALSISSATVRRWEHGTHIPNNHHAAQLDQVLDYPPGTMRRAAEIRTGHVFTWESIKNLD